jgi:hypothetical protein
MASASLGERRACLITSVRVEPSPVPTAEPTTLIIRSITHAPDQTVARLDGSSGSIRSRRSRWRHSDLHPIFMTFRRAASPGLTSCESCPVWRSNHVNIIDSMVCSARWRPQLISDLSSVLCVRPGPHWTMCPQLARITTPALWRRLSYGCDRSWRDRVRYARAGKRRSTLARPTP